MRKTKAGRKEENGLLFPFFISTELIIICIFFVYGGAGFFVPA